MLVKKTVEINANGDTVDDVIKALQETPVPKDAKVVKIENDYQLMNGLGYVFKAISVITVEWDVEE